MGQLLGKAKNFMAEKIVNIDASVTDLDLVNVYRDRVEYNAKVPIYNPYGNPLRLSQVSYSLKSAGRMIISGKMADPGSLKANDTTLINVALVVPHDIIVSLVKDIGKDWDIDYELELGLTFDLPIIGDFTIPLSKSGQIKLPTLRDLI